MQTTTRKRKHRTARTRPNSVGTVPVSVRFPVTVLKQIDRVAQLEGESASSWIRRHAMRALRQAAREDPVEVPPLSICN